MTYNCRAFFDRWRERRDFLGETIADPALSPDLICLQESMINGAGLDSHIQKNLEKQGKRNYAIHSSAGIIHFLDTHGVPEVFPLLVGVIFRVIIRTQQLLLVLPIVQFLVASLPLLFEILREFVGRMTEKWFGKKIDIFEMYYVSLAPHFGLSILIGGPSFVSHKSEVISLQPNLAEVSCSQLFNVRTIVPKCTHIIFTFYCLMCAPLFQNALTLFSHFNSLTRCRTTWGAVKGSLWAIPKEKRNFGS